MKQDKYIGINDEELFLRFQENNDKAAFNALYERYSRKVYTYCLRSLNDREKAQDVFQRVMLNVVDKKDSFKGGSYLAWLMIITRNFVLMDKRSVKYTDEITETTLTTTQNEEYFLREQIQDALDQLPVEFKEVIELRYFDEFAYEQIAEIQNISLSLVKVRLFRAKKMLSQILSPLREQLV